MLKNIRIVLIGTTHPGNIGATARAMKTMGLERLYLVAPKHFPNIEATSRASGAEDLLENATITDTLTDAVADCSLVIGTSARKRNLTWTPLWPKECAEKVAAEAKQHQVAIIFGKERTGLTNEELALCHYHVTIPSNPDFASLNIASAVQIIAHDIYSTVISEQIEERKHADKAQYASSQDMELFYQHLEKIMIETDFLDPAEPKKLMLRVKRLFSRARPETQEINILRGILTAIEKKL